MHKARQNQTMPRICLQISIYTSTSYTPPYSSFLSSLTHVGRWRVFKKKQVHELSTILVLKKTPGHTIITPIQCQHFLKHFIFKSRLLCLMNYCAFMLHRNIIYGLNIENGLLILSYCYYRLILLACFLLQTVVLSC